MPHADRGQNPIIRTKLKVVNETAKEMKTILDSLGITTKKLKESNWSDRKKNLSTFKGPLLSPTRRKVNNLCNREYEKLDESLSMLVTAKERFETKGQFKRLLDLWKNDQKNIQVYGGFILKELSRSEESAIYRALTEEGLKKPQATLDKLQEVVTSFRKIMSDLENYAKNSQDAFEAEGITGLLKV